MPPETTTPATGADAGFGLQVALSAVAGAACTVVWVAAGGGPFWPRWVWFGLLVGIGVHLLVRWATLLPDEPGRRLRIGMVVLAAVTVVDLAVWATAGGGPFWPIWPLLGSAVIAASVWAVEHRDRLPWATSRELVERVEELTRSRSGALDVQATQLRQIERDLHDGAQVRLVALSMQLGRAETRLEDDGDDATLALVRGARSEVSAVIGELRDLARGIAPPVLIDRGLGAAAEALGQRSASNVEVDAEIAERPVPVVESAAYFVVAESLANASKHAPGAAVSVRIRRHADDLVVEVRDDGPGGADPGGSGLGGLRHRVEAIDGRLTVESPRGAGTLIRAELPCAR